MGFKPRTMTPALLQGFNATTFRSHKAAAFLFCCSTLSTASLHVAVITGTTRTEGPPRPILGPRIARFVQQSLERRGNTVTMVDPRDLPLLEKPYFSYSKSKPPPLVLQEIHDIFEKADAYVTVTPEYNHAPSPGLLNVLNHFGSSTFSFKPSAIVSYSAGQWGGTRAAHSLRPILSELGCIPVSAMIHIPFAQDALEEDGRCKADHDRWTSYADRCFVQLEWWGDAAREHRQKVDPKIASPPFRSTPSQRNAP